MARTASATPSGTLPEASRLPRDYLDERTTAATAFRSASLAATFLWSSPPPVFRRLTILPSAAASPLYFCATEANDGAFLVVDAVWQLPHFSLAMMSSPGPAKARPLRARVTLQAAMVGINFMLGSLENASELLIWSERDPVLDGSPADPLSVGRFCPRGVAVSSPVDKEAV